MGLPVLFVCENNQYGLSTPIGRTCPTEAVSDKAHGYGIEHATVDGMDATNDLSYLILEVAPDYSWALIGQPSRKYAWVFARDPRMDDALYTELVARFAHYGYDPSRLRRIPQFADQAGQPGFQ